MYKILVAESLDKKVMQEEQAKAGTEFSWDYQPDISINDLERNIGDYDALIVRPKEVTEHAIANALNLKLIVRGGAGVNSIALDAARHMGIVVENTPGLNSTATAECTFALLHRLLARRNIMEADNDVWSGQEKIPDAYVGNELEGKHLALVGLGNIGKRVAHIARGYGMQVTVWSPQITLERAEEVGAELAESLGTLCRLQPDAITLHIPLLPETTGIMNARYFTMLKPGTVLINTARPQLLNVEDFKDALDSGIITGYGIDGDPDQVEPFRIADPARRGILLPHIGDATQEAMEKITRACIRQVVAFFSEDQVMNPV